MVRLFSVLICTSIFCVVAFMEVSAIAACKKCAAQASCDCGSGSAKLPATSCARVGNVYPDGWQTKGHCADWYGPMPQTNYNPHYGCYPGAARTMNRYSAFHGYYYRKPYNYRQYAEYPWDAEMAEPKPYPKREVVSEMSAGAGEDPNYIILSDEIISGHKTQPAAVPTLAPMPEPSVPLQLPARTTL